MKKTLLQTFIESWGNTILGFLGSVLIQYGVAWWYALPLHHEDNFVIISVFTAWSLARNFCWGRLMERLHIRRVLTAAMNAVINERFRQIEIEGYDAAHDKKNSVGDLASAAAAYLLTSDGGGQPVPPACWRWGTEHWNPKDLRRNLIRGCALGLAALDRLEAMRKPAR